MVKALTPVRIARISRQSVNNAVETAELDFQLDHRQGVLIHAVEFLIGQLLDVGATSIIPSQAGLSLHAETGNLENTADALVDATVLNSEVIAEAVIQSIVLETAAAGGGAAMQWLSPNVWNYNELLGQPLLLATNLTFRVFSSAAVLTVNGGAAHVFYQYVTLTDAELANQFILRR